MSNCPLLLNIHINLLFIKDVINSSKIHFIRQNCGGHGSHIYFFVFSFFFARGKVTPDLVKWVPARINWEKLWGHLCVSACYLSVIMMLSQQSRFHCGPNQFEMHTILHRTRARRLITPLQIVLGPAQQIRRRPTFTLNNWDNPASPSDVTARRNTLETSENARRLTSRQRNILLKHRAVCFNECLKGEFDISANSVFIPLNFMESKRVVGLQFVQYIFFYCNRQSWFVKKNTIKK